MKILCEHEHCGPFFVSEGYRHVFEAMGHTFKYWSPTQQAAFDAFDEFEPDLFMGRTFTIDRARYKCIAARPAMKVMLYASAWGDLIESIPLDKYPIVAIKDDEKRLLAQLKEQTGKPDFVWLHYHDNWVERTLGGWRSIGIEPVGLMNAADIFDYGPGKYREELACDVGFVGGYWGYKARNLGPYMLPLCHASRGIRVKIFGNQPWPVAQYLGLIDTPSVRDLFVSATVCPNVHEPHSTDFGFDIVERPFKVLSAGGFCVSDRVDAMVNDVFNQNEIPFASTPKEFHEMVEHFVRNPEERKPYAERGQRMVLCEHTYFERVQKALKQLGMYHDASGVSHIKFHTLKMLAAKPQ